MDRCRFLPPHLFEEVKGVLQRNSYSIHHENLLIAMLWDENRKTREKAFNYIMQARLEKKTINIRYFKVPKVYIA